MSIDQIEARRASRRRPTIDALITTGALIGLIGCLTGLWCAVLWRAA